MTTPHPAKFNNNILDAIRELLPPPPIEILDPFAGVGRVHELATYGVETWGVELEPEWAKQHPSTFVGSALDLQKAIFWIGRGRTYDYLMDAIVTSPCYGNRMADTYAGDAKGSRRHTYRISLGRPVSEGSSASMQWGEEYRVFHRRAWAEATRVTTPEAVFILNIKDHVRGGKVMPVTTWHVGALRNLGWKEDKRIRVDAPGNRHGENHELRVGFESVIRFRKRWDW